MRVFSRCYTPRFKMNFKEVNCMIIPLVIKGISGLTIVGCSSAIGFIKGNELDERVNDIVEFRRIINILEMEIGSKRNGLPYALLNVSKKTNCKKFKELFSVVAYGLNDRDGKTLQEIVEVAIGNIQVDEKLKIVILEMFKVIGEYSVENELSNLKAFNLELEQLETEERAFRDKYKKIITSSGGLIGTLVTILLL